MRKSSILFILGLVLLVGSNAARWILLKVGLQIIAAAFLLGAGHEHQREEREGIDNGKGLLGGGLT